MPTIFARSSRNDLCVYSYAAKKTVNRKFQDYILCMSRTTYTSSNHDCTKLTYKCLENIKWLVMKTGECATNICKP